MLDVGDVVDLLGEGLPIAFQVGIDPMLEKHPRFTDLVQKIIYLTTDAEAFLEKAELHRPSLPTGRQATSITGPSILAIMSYIWCVEEWQKAVPM